MSGDVLSVGDRIRNLLGRYCERIDAGDFDGVGELFAGGACADERGRPFARGAAEVAAWYRDGMQLYDGRPGTRHLVADTVIEDPADDGTIEARSAYLVLQAAPGFPLQPIASGRYVDTFAPDDAVPGGWRWAERRFTIDQLGDLSHHWAGPTG